MKSSCTIHLQGDWNQDAKLCLWALTETGEPIPASELKLLLFAQEPAVYYGAHAETWEDGPLGGVCIPAKDVPAYLRTPSANPLVQLQWSASLLVLREIAADVQTAVAEHLLVPVFRHGVLTWMLPSPEHEERFPALAAALQQERQLTWITAYLTQSTDLDAERLQALGRLEQLSTQLATGEGASAASLLDDQDLLRLAGWNAPQEPYIVGFRLDDPQQSNTDEWKLRFLLIDRAHPALVIPCDEAGVPMQETPAHWGFVEREAPLLLAAWLRFLPALEDEHHPERLRTKLDDQQAWLFLTELSTRITHWGGQVLLPAWWNRLRTNRPKLTAQLRSAAVSHEPALFGLDHMLDYDWKIAVGNLELTEEEFLQLAKEQKPLHFIQGEWISLDAGLVEKIKRAVERSKRKKGISLREVLMREYSSAKDEPLYEDSADDWDWEIETDQRLLDWMRRLERVEPLPKVPVSPRFRGQLRTYQQEGLAWLIYLRQFGLGGCLADDMGLGKTIQYIAYLLHVKEHEAPAAPSLLVCPTSLIGNWQKELERFAPDLKVVLHYGADRPRDIALFQEQIADCDVVMTTYMTAMLDAELFRAIQWSSLCADEAQNMKNAHTKQAATIRRLGADQRIALTGTPIENRLSELWSIIDFTNPGYLGSLSSFQRQYSLLAEQNKQRASTQLRRLVRPFMMRRMKTDPAIAPDLPEKIEAKVYVPLTAEQAALYENVLERLLTGLERKNQFDRRGSILAALTQLKQICDHPALYTKERHAAAIHPRRSHKTARLLEMIGELRQDGDSCLIFTQYVEMGAMLQRLLERTLKEPVLYLHGSTTKQERDRMVEQFQSGAAAIFVLSLRAGGTGLNLTAASHVFHYDRWWNPAVENQATDRAYRIGQERLVQVHKFITLGTLEERIDEMIERKQGLSRDIIDTSEQWVTELSAEELEDLITLRRSWIDGES